MTQEYSIVIPAKASTGEEYGGGWAAGNIIAHWFHLKKQVDIGLEAGVFWSMWQRRKGIMEQDKPFLNDLPYQFGKPRKTECGLTVFSNIGYFYENAKKAITWQFKADYMTDWYNVKRNLSSLRQFIPPFREVYLSPGYEGTVWILIRDLKKLRAPLNGKPLNGAYEFPQFKFHSNILGKEVNLTTSHIAGFAFVVGFPRGLEVEEPDPEQEIGEYLKQFLSNNPPKGRLREEIIRDVFLMEFSKKGYVLWKEGTVKSGRFDVLFKDADKQYVAVEFKVKGDAKAAIQLSNYIKDLKREIKEEIEGLVVCGQISPELEELAKQYGFKLVEFRPYIEIPI